jgi:acyl-CoA thioesterase
VSDTVRDVGNPWDDLRLEPAGDGRFTTAISDAWMLRVVPQGGVAAAIAEAAMRATLDQPEQVLRTTTSFFVGQVQAGPVEVDVEVLRRGRSMSQLRASVRNPGSAAGLTATAVYGAPRAGFEFVDLAYPEVDGPEGLRGYRDPVPEGVDFEPTPPLPFWEQIVECRPATGRAPWEPYEPGPAEIAYWYRLDDPPSAADGSLDVAGLLVAADTMPGAIWQKLEPDAPPWFGPSLDLTLHVLGPAAPGWLLVHNRARVAAGGYASVESVLWDPASRTPAAYATQVMFFAFL